MDLVRQQADALSAAVERLWSPSLIEALVDDESATLGLALARAISHGWVEAKDRLSEPFAAAEAFLADYVQDGQDDGA